MGDSDSDSSEESGGATSSLSYADNFTFNRGDVNILLTVNGQRVLGKVCSGSMVHASTVWEKFIFPPWGPSLIAKNDSDKDSYIDFSEDNSDALLVLLHIVHLVFKSVPRSELPFEMLLSLAKLCDQYQCVKLVDLFLEDWLGDDVSRASEYEPSLEGWLFIACAFGRHTMFSQVAERLVKEIWVDGDGYVWYSLGAEPWKTMLEVEDLPPGLKEILMEVRLKTIKA